ncbi:hypothetical protein [Gracilimonas mengyeensis]|uniref:FlgN protein n=1 Tax=Gracilimonas mengyeensis TaxID=1302730 RepID=A0A521FJW3_9BACT|nr:hypothetical protein [Gracilimonas mengyeensis]SMO95890.1 hypothetical protein SAMN06265219_11954 [Gracilimonas mengyeensis]
MSPIHTLISKINNSSNKILEELDNEEPSFSVIENELNLKGIYVQKLTEYENQYPASSFEKNELDELNHKFDLFTRLNENIQKKAKQLLHLQQEKLAMATKHREAEDQYNISKNPNISYF